MTFVVYILSKQCWMVYQLVFIVICIDDKYDSYQTVCEPFSFEYKINPKQLEGVFRNCETRKLNVLVWIESWKLPILNNGRTYFNNRFFYRGRGIKNMF